MPYRLIRTSLLYAILFVAGINVLGLPFDGTFLSFLALPGVLLAPGIWIVYGLFDVNNHDLLPLVMCELVNILIYWIVFIPLVALLWRRKRVRTSGPGNPH
jgi:hypothetical protein